MQNWISIDDELPELLKRVLLFDKNGLGVLSGRLGHFGWYLEGDLDINSSITHWQPLPEPPKD